MQEIADLIDQGKVKVVIASTFELREAALKENHIRGEVVLKVVD